MAGRVLGMRAWVCWLGVRQGAQVAQAGIDNPPAARCMPLPHMSRLCGGQRKRKHELIQDMLAYHSCSRRSSSSNGGVRGGLSSSRSSGGLSSSKRAGAAAAALGQRASSAGAQVCSTVQQQQQQPLSVTPADAAPARSAAAGPGILQTFAATSAAFASAAGASCAQPAPAPREGGAGHAGTPVRASLGSSAADQELQHAAPSPAAGTPGGAGSASRWASWLTPLSRKKQQQQSGGGHDAATDRGAGSSSRRRSRGGGRARTPPPRQPRFEDALASQPRAPAASASASASEQEDAIPRDKQHAAAASKPSSVISGSRGSGTTAQHRYGTPQRPATRVISGCTGSLVVSQLYVDSPAVKIAPSSSSGSTAGAAAGGGGPQSSAHHQLRLPLDAPVPHRSRWRQVQLGGDK